MFGMKNPKSTQSPPYATRADFCRIFQKDMNRLYLLSFLLTGDEAIAEQCFVGGLHVAQEGNPVFKEWAEAWARRAIILNAIRMIRPRLTTVVSYHPDREIRNPVANQAEVAEILKLPPFERFAFVMSVLEGYADHECALHLGCSRGEIVAARTRALEQMGRSAEQRHKLRSFVSGEKERAAASESQARITGFPSLAVSA